eukprot:3058820-Pleurochrysis_carterae.AAC.1
MTEFALVRAKRSCVRAQCAERARATRRCSSCKMWSAGQSKGNVMPKAPPTRQCFISFQMLSQ